MPLIFNTVNWLLTVSHDKIKNSSWLISSYSGISFILMSKFENCPPLSAHSLTHSVQLLAASALFCAPSTSTPLFIFTMHATMSFWMFLYFSLYSVHATLEHRHLLLCLFTVLVNSCSAWEVVSLRNLPIGLWRKFSSFTLLFYSLCGFIIKFIRFNFNYFFLKMGTVFHLLLCFSA